MVEIEEVVVVRGVGPDAEVLGEVEPAGAVNPAKVLGGLVKEDRVVIVRRAIAAVNVLVGPEDEVAFNVPQAPDAIREAEPPGRVVPYPSRNG